MAQDVLLKFPNFGSPFYVYTDASNLQIGGVVSQDNHPLGYFSRKFNKSQVHYTTMNKELLSIVETLKYYRYILFTHRIFVYTDHKNLTHEETNYASDRVLRQRLVIDNYGATIKYIQGI